MKFLQNLVKIIFITLILNISLSKQSDNSRKEINYKRKAENSDFEPIRILIDTSIIEKEYKTSEQREKAFLALENCNKTLSDLIKVKRITKNTPIKLDFNSFPELNLSKSIVNGTLEKGNSDYDLILIASLSLEISTTEIKILSRAEDNRPTLGFFDISIVELVLSNEANLNFLLLHHLIHFLGFSYENFDYFIKLGAEKKVYETQIENYIRTNYIITPKVLEIAKKYYNCKNITRIPLDNNDGNLVAHWDSRLLLGDIMSSYNENYKIEQAISELTLALLEDSGWYEINYYTGGLMRFGKNKGCDFIYKKCSSIFKNEFCEDSKYLSCSSGRQSRTYCKYNSNPYIPEIDSCLINEPYTSELIADEYVGNCKYSKTKDVYGSIYDQFFHGNKRSDIMSNYYETFSDNSFCVLVSMIPNASSDDENINYLLQKINAICYELFCSDTTLTIKINEQYITCPRQGGKVKIGGYYQGHIYCPDYNLICTGTTLCNDIFDCVNKKSLVKYDTFDYNYIIETSQIPSELTNSELLEGYENSLNGKCRMNCSQCYQNGTCYKCRKDYFLVGEYFGEDLTKIKCLNINVNLGYYLYNNIYYPCLSNCDKCTNGTICIQCSQNYYFIGNNRSYCDTGKDLTKYYTNDGGISYFPCDTKFPYCETCSGETTCNRCIKDYYFIGEKKEKCQTLPDKTKYFTEDEGISYLLCSNYITKCTSCISRNNCTLCDQNYYMMGDDRSICVNNIINNFREYYSEPGPAYYLCDTHFPYCLYCQNKNTCDDCKNNYIFLRGEKNECFSFEQDKTYLENGNYYPCYDPFPLCDLCKSKGSCYKCMKDYYLIYDEKNNLKCEDIDINKYYQNENGIYELCSKAINNCDECDNSTMCNKCKKNYYIVKDDRTSCRNDLDLRKYYTEDEGISYFPCNEVLEQCNFCSNKSVCEQCLNNFYFYKDIKNKCFNLGNLEKFYKKENAYYPCNESISSCDKCANENTCYECNNNLKIILDQQNFCYPDNILSKNNSLVKKNETFYMKCSESIENCDLCENLGENNITCLKCEKNYIFLNEDKTKCIYKYELTPDDEYIKINDTNYFTCDYKGIKNCKKCKNLNSCELCSNNYAFLNHNYTFCHKKSDMEKGYYHDYNEIMYFPCLQNCDICVNGKECIQCKENFMSFAENTYCGICELNVTYIYDNITEELIYELSEEYIDKNKLNYGFVKMYINADNNYNIIIFRTSQCTELIFEQIGYAEINLNELNKKIDSKISRPYIIINTNYKHKNIFEFYYTDYNASNHRKINISEICPECEEYGYLKIKNNFKDELDNKLSEVLMNKVISNEHNIFTDDEPIFNDLCHNFNIKKIDIPINERRNILYLGNYAKEILCNDINCDIKNIIFSNTTSFCDCGIKYEFNYLFSDEEINNNEVYNNFLQEKKSINSFLLFTCAKEAFTLKNIKNNIGFFISLGLFVIQLVLLLVYINYKSSKNRKSKKKIKSNPPKLDKMGSFTISDDLENDNGDYEQKNQKKETQIFEEKKFYEKNILDEDSDEEGDGEQKIQDKDIDSVREREIENQIIELGGTITEENLKIQENIFQKSRNGEIMPGKYLNKGKNETKNKNKLNFLEEESYEGDEVINDDNDSNNKVKKRNDKLYRRKKNYSLGSKESFTSEEIQNEVYQKTEYIKFSDAIKKKEISFLAYYFKLIQLKQPIINLLSPIKILKLEESHIPTLVKIMRMIFYLSLYIFFNLFHLEQKYFRKKFEFFNNKYNIISENMNEDISSNEIFKYSLVHTILSGFISFIICLIIKSVINYFIFNIKKKMNLVILKSKKNKKIREEEKIHEIFLIMKKAKKKFIIFFSICLAIMILIFYAMINFNEVYHGGILDLIAGVFWTFIFLQIIPFIYCLIFAFIRYLGIKKKNEKMYYFSQIIFF